MKDFSLGGDAAEWLGVRYRTLLSTAESGGGLSITDSHAPARSGPPRHIHHDADEIFVLLDGACDFWLEGHLLHRVAGETVFVPRGAEHTYRVPDHTHSRHLVIMTPGGFEGFFGQMAQEGCRIPEDLVRVAEVGRTYSLEFTGPPLGVGE